MIEYLKGILAEKKPAVAIIDCAGVGYQVHIPLSTYDNLPQSGSTVKVHIYYSFNETDGVRLFGFSSTDDKQLFKYLISVSKIGPKTALSVLSTLAVQDLIHAVQVGDVKLISTVPGIGKKSAERLIIELKDKVGSIAGSALPSLGGLIQSDVRQEAEDALVALGYKQIEIRKSIRELCEKEEFDTSKKIVKAVIKSLYKNRKI